MAKLVDRQQAYVRARTKHDELRSELADAAASVEHKRQEIDAAIDRGAASVGRLVELVSPRIEAFYLLAPPTEAVLAVVPPQVIMLDEDGTMTEKVDLQPKALWSIWLWHK